MGVRPRANRTVDLDGEVGTAPGLKALGAALQALAELLDLGSADAGMTTDLDPLIVTALPGIGISTDDEAVQLANVVDFGLGGAVWSTDEQRAIKVAEQLEVGMANVNTPAGEGADLPFGGTKRSGFGRELGPLGIDEFVNKRLFYVEK